jgi:hypothetical protein
MKFTFSAFPKKDNNAITKMRSLQIAEIMVSSSEPLELAFLFPFGAGFSKMGDGFMASVSNLRVSIIYNSINKGETKIYIQKKN